MKNPLSRMWHAFDGLAADTLWAGAKDLSQMINAYVSVQILQVTFGKEILGNYFGMFGVIGIFGAFTASGVALSALQRILGEKQDPQSILRRYLTLTLLLSFGSLGVAIAAGYFKLKFLPVSAIIFLAVAELIVAGVIAVISSVVQGKVGFPASARIRIGIVAIRFVATTSLFFTGMLTIRNLALGFLVGFTIYTAWLLFRYLPKHDMRFSFTRPTKVEVGGGLTFSFPMAAARIQTDGEKYLLNSFGYVSDAGLYGLAFRGMQVANAPIAALEAAAFQRFLPKEEGGKGVHWRRANRFTMLMFGASVVLTGVIYLALPVLSVILFREDTRQAADILPWLLGLIPLMAVSGTPLNGLLGLGRAKERGYVFLVSSIVSVIAYLVFIPEYSWRGAVAATYFSEVFLILFGWLALWYYQKVEDDRIDAGFAEAQSTFDVDATIEIPRLDLPDPYS